MHHARGRNTYCACICFTWDVDALLHSRPSGDRQSVPVQIYFCLFKMTSQGQALTRIPQVRSGLAGYYICEAIHETGILVALDLASLTFAILCRERGTHGLPGCNDRMRCPCKLFPATWRCGLLLVVGHISYR
jgi:hypothetical protein